MLKPCSVCSISPHDLQDVGEPGLFGCGLLVVAVGIAPIALALHGTPQTEGAAKLWWRTILGTLGTVVMQAVALHTTLSIFLNPNTNLTVLGLPGDPGAVMNLLIVVCLLWGVLKIPVPMSRNCRIPSSLAR